MTTENSSAIARFRSMSQLSDHQLKADFFQLSQKGHRLDAELLLYLGELDQRRLYREEACSSAFGFCVTRMGYSEDVAYKRVGAARLMRQFPRIYDLLAEGKLHLTALMLLKPHLTVDNHQDWLLAACNKSKREVELLVASRCPVPAAQTTVRRLPSPKPAPIPPSAPVASAPTMSSPTGSEEGALSQTIGAVEATPLSAVSATAAVASAGSAAPPRSAGSAGKVSQAGQVAPLSSSTYRVTFTASAELKQKLDRARELLSHRIPPSDLPALIERALDQLLEREQTRRYGATQKRKPAESPRRDCTVPGDADPNQAQAESTEATESACPGHHAGCRNALDPDPNLNDNTIAAGYGAPSAAGYGAAVATATSHHRRQPGAEVRRAVFERDAGQCTFVDRQGRRCDQRRTRLEGPRRSPTSG
jgi:hypothetical protein